MESRRVRYFENAGEVFKIIFVPAKQVTAHVRFLVGGVVTGGMGALETFVFSALKGHVTLEAVVVPVTFAAIFTLVPFKICKEM